MVKDAAKVRLLTGAGLVDAKVVQVDAADDLALLKADGRFAPLPILPSKSVQLGSTVATIGFPDPGLQGFAPKLAKGEMASLSGAGDDARYFQISVPCQPGNSGGAHAPCVLFPAPRRKHWWSGMGSPRHPTPLTEGTVLPISKIRNRQS